MAKQGYIKLYRQIQDNEIWQDDAPFNRRDAWIDLLLMANHKDNKVIGKDGAVLIKAGQILTSVRKLSERWKWGKDRTLRYLRLLEQCDMIKRETETVNATLITLVNYEVYQGKADTNKDTDKDTNKPQTIMIKNVNNNIKPFSKNKQFNSMEQQDYDFDLLEKKGTK